MSGEEAVDEIHSESEEEFCADADELFMEREIEFLEIALIIRAIC